MKKLILLALAACAIAAAQNPHAVTLTWGWTQGTGGAASSYDVQRGTVSGGPYATIGTVPSANIFSYVDTASPTNVLNEGQAYFYVVTAVGPGGTSQPSNQTAVTIPVTVAQPPNAPTTLQSTVH